MKIFGLTISSIILLYFGSVSIGLRYYLSELVFKQIPDVKSAETKRYSVDVDDAQLVIRQYGSSLNTKCVIFFPGQHGGIIRYENEIFESITNRDVAFFAFSYPGFEGAKGKSTLDNILSTSIAGLEYVERNTSCKIKTSIFIGRSLGASVALEVAETIQPKGLVLDSVAFSLTDSIKVKFSNSIFTKPLNLLPIGQLVSYDIFTSDSLDRLKIIPIVVFQGQYDLVTPLKNIDSLLNEYENVTLNIVEKATHMNTHILAGSKYVNTVLRLLWKAILTSAYTWIVLILGILCSVTLQHKIPKIKTTGDARRQQS